MAKIPIILEAGRADGKLIKTNSVYDDNQEKFLSDKIKEIDDNHNNLTDKVNTLTEVVNNNELDIENKLETEKTRATNAENNLRKTINNITKVNENATSANIVTIDTIPSTSSSNVQQALNELFENTTNETQVRSQNDQLLSQELSKLEDEINVINDKVIGEFKVSGNVERDKGALPIGKVLEAKQYQIKIKNETSVDSKVIFKTTPQVGEPQYWPQSEVDVSANSETVIRAGSMLVGETIAICYNKGNWSITIYDDDEFTKLQSELSRNVKELNAKDNNISSAVDSGVKITQSKTGVSITTKKVNGKDSPVQIENADLEKSGVMSPEHVETLEKSSDVVSQLRDVVLGVYEKHFTTTREGEGVVLDKEVSHLRSYRFIIENKSNVNNSVTFKSGESYWGTTEVPANSTVEVILRPLNPDTSFKFISQKIGEWHIEVRDSVNLDNRVQELEEHSKTSFSPFETENLTDSIQWIDNMYFNKALEQVSSTYFKCAMIDVSKYVGCLLKIKVRTRKTGSPDPAIDDELLSWCGFKDANGETIVSFTIRNRNPKIEDVAYVPVPGRFVAKTVSYVDVSFNDAKTLCISSYKGLIVESVEVVTKCNDTRLKGKKIAVVGNSQCAMYYGQDTTSVLDYSGCKMTQGWFLYHLAPLFGYVCTNRAVGGSGWGDIYRQFTECVGDISESNKKFFDIVYIMATDNDGISHFLDTYTTYTTGFTKEIDVTGSSNLEDIQKSVVLAMCTILDNSPRCKLYVPMYVQRASDFKGAFANGQWHTYEENFLKALCDVFNAKKISYNNETSYRCWKEADGYMWNRTSTISREKEYNQQVLDIGDGIHQATAAGGWDIFKVTFKEIWNDCVADSMFC